MALSKNYHSMKPSDKIEAQQAEYRQLNKMYTMGSEKPDKVIMSKDTFNALVEFSEWAETQDELMPSMDEEEPDWFMDAFDAKDVDL